MVGPHETNVANPTLAKISVEAFAASLQKNIPVAVQQRNSEIDLDVAVGQRALRQLQDAFE